MGRDRQRLRGGAVTAGAATGTPAAVASGHPLATEAAVELLRAGGSALDAALAADAVMGVVEPFASGIGGDAMAMIAGPEGFVAYNGTGRSPATLPPSAVRAGAHGYLLGEGGSAVTVPGTVASWWDLHRRFGVASWAAVLRPAVRAALDGFPVGTVAAAVWAGGAARLDAAGRSLFVPAGRSPVAGEVWRNPALAEVLLGIADEGPGHLSRGETGAAVCRAVEEAGGALRPDDLEAHEGAWVEPLTAVVAGYELATVPPNCHGVVALLAAADLDERGLLGGPPSPAAVVARVEALDRAFAVALEAVCDRRGRPAPAFAGLRRAHRAAGTGGPLPYGPGTVLTAVARGDTFVTMISSVCDRFGSGVTVPSGGFVLQSRARGFNADADHPNGVAPGKRPYHTIIPTVGRRDGRPALAFGVVGGIMQPQGQVQVLAGLAAGPGDVQAAVDGPRFRLLGGARVALEAGHADDVAPALARAGYAVAGPAGVDFGGAQVVAAAVGGGLTAATDRRKDGTTAVLALPGEPVGPPARTP